MEDVVTMLQQWVTIAPEQVKLCAFSRGDNVLMNNLPDSSRIRLYDLTDLIALVVEIVEKAQGIFPPWAALAVKEIRRRFEN